MSHNTLYRLETSISELSLDDLRSLKETIFDAIKDLEAKERKRKRLASLVKLKTEMIQNIAGYDDILQQYLTYAVSPLDLKTKRDIEYRHRYSNKIFCGYNKDRDNSSYWLEMDCLTMKLTGECYYRHIETCQSSVEEEFETFNPYKPEQLYIKIVTSKETMKCYSDTTMKSYGSFKTLINSLILVDLSEDDIPEEDVVHISTIREYVDGKDISKDKLFASLKHMGEKIGDNIVELFLAIVFHLIIKQTVWW